MHLRGCQRTAHYCSDLRSAPTRSPSVLGPILNYDALDAWGQAYGVDRQRSPYTLAYVEARRGADKLMQLIRSLLSFTLLVSMVTMSLVVHHFQQSLYQSASLKSASCWKNGDGLIAVVCCMWRGPRDVDAARQLIGVAYP